jgi:hypothetical protein
MRSTTVLIALAFVLASPAPARAQVSIGAAYIVSLLPTRDPNSYENVLAIVPSGRTNGIVGFLAAGLSRHIGLQGEISDPGWTPSSIERSRSDTSPQFTAGLDLPIPLGKHFSLLPTGRVHVISRGRTEPFDPFVDPPEEVPLGQPSSFTYRLGLGGRLDF